MNLRVTLTPNFSWVARTPRKKLTASAVYWHQPVPTVGRVSSPGASGIFQQAAKLNAWRRGTGKMYQLLGDRIDPIIAELNEALAA
jgi:hypothetical protein